VSATPILDLVKDPPRQSVRTWTPVLIGVPLGLLFGIGLGLSFKNAPELNGLLFFPALYVAIAIHEVGHLVAGKIVGMPPGALVIGGIVIFKSGPRWLVRFDSQRLFDGFAKVLPPKNDFRPAPFAWMVAGGPIASFLFSLTCVLGLALYGRGTWAWIGTLYWVSIMITSAALIPFSSGLNKSDGARLWLLVRHPDQCRSWMAVLGVQTEETEGLMPREWDAALVNQMLQADASMREYPYIQLLAFYRCIDQNNEQLALEHLENALATSARCGKRLRQCLFLEAGSSSAYLRGNVIQARAWLERVGKVERPLSTDEIEAAIATSEKRWNDALRHLGAVRSRIEHCKTDSGLVRFAKERLAVYEQLCKSESCTNS
jgi:hypothetical protein